MLLWTTGNDCLVGKRGEWLWRVIEGEKPLFSPASVERMSGWRILTRRRATLTTFGLRGRRARRRERGIIYRVGGSDGQLKRVSTERRDRRE